MKLPPLFVDATTFSQLTFIDGSSWEKYATIEYPQTQNKNRLKYVMQNINKITMQEETVYAHTGMKVIDGELCYLYQGGAIGNINNVNVDLSNVYKFTEDYDDEYEDKLTRYCFTDKIFNVTDAIKTSYDMLDFAEHSITIPLLALTYLAPLHSLLKKENILTDFSIYIQGVSGCGKSTTAADFLCHFGKFSRDYFPCNFSDTANAIEQKAHILKDTINVVDDFKPEQDMKKQLSTLEAICRMYGDRAGRDRMQKDAKSRNTAYTARGLCIITGEIMPEVAQSRVARCLFLEMQKNSINSEKKIYIENNLEKLAFAMKKNIELTIYNYQNNNLMNKIKTYYNSLKGNPKIESMHGRTYEIGLALKLGFWLFTEFLSAYKIENSENLKKLLKEANETIDHLLEIQTEEIQEKDPVEMFFNALAQLTSTKSAILKDLNTSPLERKVSDCKYNDFIGFVDKTENIYYLLPEQVYHKVLQFYNNINITFPIPASTLWRYLAEKNYLQKYKSKGRNASYKTPKTIDNRNYNFIKLSLPDFKLDTDDNHSFGFLETRRRGDITPFKREKIF